LAVAWRWGPNIFPASPAPMVVVRALAPLRQ